MHHLGQCHRSHPGVCLLTLLCPLADILTVPPDLHPVFFPSLPLLFSQVWPDGSQSILTEVSREVSASLSFYPSPLFGVCMYETKPLMFSHSQLQPNIFLYIHPIGSFYSFCNSGWWKSIIIIFFFLQSLFSRETNLELIVWCS